MASPSNYCTFALLLSITAVQEWTQLRRSFRYDEYSKIAEANPPQGPWGKVRTAVKFAVYAVCGFASNCDSPFADLLTKPADILNVCLWSSAIRQSLSLPIHLLMWFTCASLLLLQASYAAGSAVVRLLSRADRWLEERRLFSALLPQALPKEVFDTKTGGMTAQCKQVRGVLELELGSCQCQRRCLTHRQLHHSPV
jgi:hypothetical protein